MNRRPRPRPRGGGRRSSARSVRTSTTCTPPASTAAMHRGRELGGGADLGDRDAVHRGERAEVDAAAACRTASRSARAARPAGGTRRSRRRRCRRRRTWRRRRGRRAPSRPLVSCRKHRSPSSATVGPSDAAATPSTVDTNPSMPFTPRLASTVDAVAGRGEALDVAHRHARRDHERRVRRAARATTSRATRPSNGSSHAVEERVDRGARRARRRRATRRTHSVVDHHVDARRRARRAAARGRRPCVRSPRAAGRATRRRDRRAPGRSSASSHCIATLLVSGAPMRSTTSGRCAAANAGDAQQRVVGRDRCPGTRRFEIGSASTGQPGGLGEAQRRVVGLHARAPARRPRARAACRPTRCGERVEHLDRRARARRARVAVHGRPSERPGASTSGVAGRHQRLAERQVEVHRARPAARAPSATARDASARHAAPTPGAVARARSASWNQRTASP